MLICAGAASATDFTRVDSLINAAIGEKIVPGAVLCVARGDSILYRKAYGYRQLVPVQGQAEDWKGPVPMTENTVFDLASCTKVAATTIAVMQLWEQGRLKLDAPVGKYLKPFRGQDLRVIDLLTHTSGFIGDKWKKLAGYDRFLAYGDKAQWELVKYLAKESPREARNTRYSYACTNFFLLQQIVEKISGERLCDYLQRHIYSVLGLQDTRFLPLDEPIPDEYLSRVAPELAGGRIGEVHDPFARRICRGNAGNAGLFSTAEDLTRLAIALMNGGQGILKPETIAKMATVVDERFGRAIGWDVHAAKSVLKGHALSSSTIVHGGYTGTMIAIDLENKIAIVLLANRCHPEDAHYSAWQNAREVISTEIGKQLLGPAWREPGIRI